MDAPKFKIPGRERGRKPGEAAKSIKEMDWANQKPESLFDFIRGKFIALLLMAAVLIGGFSVMQRTATRPEYQKKRARRSTATAAESDPPGRDRILIVDPQGATVEDGEIHPRSVPRAPAAEEKPVAEEKGGGEVKADHPDYEREQYSSKEAMVRTFQEPLDEFEPLETLDEKDDSFLERYEMVADDDLDTPAGRANSSNYAYAAEIIYQYCRFLRTHEKNPEKVEAYYKRRKEALRAHFGKEVLSEATYRNVMPYPLEEQNKGRPNYQEYRGQLYHFAGLLMQKYQIRVWKDEENNSGIRDTWLLVCRDLKRRDQLCGVLVPHSARHLLCRDEVDNADIVSWKGLFLQRWTYENKDGEWGRMPLYVAWTITRLDQPPTTQGTNWVLIIIGVVLCLALLFVFWQTSKDNKRSGSYRRALRRKPKAGDAKPEAAATGETGTSASAEAQPAAATETQPPATPATEPPPEPSGESNDAIFGTPRD